MNKRLLGIDAWVAAAGLLGLVVACGLYRPGLGAGLPAYPLGEDEIVARARAFAQAQGHPAAGAFAIGATLRDEFRRLANRYGVEEARRVAASGEVAVQMWRVRFRDAVLFSDLDEDPAGLTLTLGPGGDVLGLDRPGSAPKDPAPPRDRAREIAREGLASIGMSLEGYEERTGGDDSKTVVVVRQDGEVDVRTKDGADGEVTVRTPGDDRTPRGEETRREEKFVWQRPDPARPGLSHRISATVTSAGLSEFGRGFTIEGGGQEHSELGDVFEATGFIFFLIGLGVTILGLGVFRLVARDYVSFWRALGAVGVFAMLSIGYQLVTTDFGGSLIAVPFKAFGLSISLGLLIMLAWLVGETDAYRAWGRHATEGLLAIFTLRPLARQVARETLEGTLVGWILVGVLAAVGAAVAQVWGPDAVRREPDLLVVDAHPSFLFAVGLLPFAYVTMVIGLMFAGSRAQRIFRRPWLWAPLAGLGVGLLVVPQELVDAEFGPLTSSLSWAIGLGIAACAVTARSGVLTGGVAVLVFTSFYYGLAGVTAGAPGDALAAAAGLALTAAPAGVALLVGAWLPEVEIREAPTPRMTSLLEQARRSEELNIAQRVQSGLLPSVDPEVEGFDISGRCLPANEVGGDYFDYFRLPRGRFGVAVGDVSGKGVPAAFFMTLTKGFMEVAAAESHGPDEALSRANGYLRDHLAKGTFVTMAYTTLDLESRQLTFARAGHNLPVLVRDGEPARLLEPSGVALGAAHPGEFERLIEPHTIEARAGDLLVLYTDGLTEAMNPAREQFGEERLLEAIDRLRDGRGSREIIDALLGEVSGFSHGAEQHDDITVVVVKVA